MPDTEHGFLVRGNDRTGQDQVWTGKRWADVPRNSTDDQCLAVGGIRISVAEAERVSSEDHGATITMIPAHDWN